MSEDKKMPETLILQGILALIFYPTVEDGNIPHPVGKGKRKNVISTGFFEVWTKKGNF